MTDRAGRGAELVQPLPATAGAVLPIHARPAHAGWGSAARELPAAVGACLRSLSLLPPLSAWPPASGRLDVSAPCCRLPRFATPCSSRWWRPVSNAGLKGGRGGSEACAPAHAAAQGPVQPLRPRRRPRRSARDLHGRAWAREQHLPAPPPPPPPGLSSTAAPGPGRRRPRRRCCCCCCSALGCSTQVGAGRVGSGPRGLCSGSGTPRPWRASRELAVLRAGGSRSCPPPLALARDRGWWSPSVRGAACGTDTPGLYCSGQECLLEPTADRVSTALVVKVEPGSPVLFLLYS